MAACRMPLPRTPTGTKPHTTLLGCYLLRAQVPLYVNKVTSTKTQLPYSYYDLPFCKVCRWGVPRRGVGGGGG